MIICVSSPSVLHFFPSSFFRSVLSYFPLSLHRSTLPSIPSLPSSSVTSLNLFHFPLYYSHFPPWYPQFLSIFPILLFIIPMTSLLFPFSSLLFPGALSSAIISEKPNVSWDDVAGEFLDPGSRFLEFDTNIDIFRLKNDFHHQFLSSLSI